MSKVLAAGCSFTNINGATPCWPEYLKINHGLDVKNIGRTAVGNEYITNKVLVELFTQPIEYDMVLIMWSGLLRQDFWVDAEVVTMYPSHRHRADNLYGNVYMAQGGNSLDICHQSIAKLKRERDLITADESRAFMSLMNIIKMQEFLKAKKIPYRFMTYVNYWNGDFRHSGSLGSLAEYKSLTMLVEQFDYENFIFYNNQRDGMYEFARDLNALDTDNFHPNQAGSSAWADFIFNKLDI